MESEQDEFCSRGEAQLRTSLKRGLHILQRSSLVSSIDYCTRQNERETQIERGIEGWSCSIYLHVVLLVFLAFLTKERSKKT
jgi:hypothetical protein